MREALMILPNLDNAGQSLAPIHRRLRLALANTFGGYTATPSEGGWVSPSGELMEEPGTLYRVAVPDGRDTVFETIAMRAARDAAQEAVYMRLPDGRVNIASLTQKEAA